MFGYPSTAEIITSLGALEHFLIKRKIIGPSWLSVSKNTIPQESPKGSWCISEVIVDSPKDVRISSSSKFTTEIPPTVVTSINLKTGVFGSVMLTIRFILSLFMASTEKYGLAVTICRNN